MIYKLIVESDNDRYLDYTTRTELNDPWRQER